MSNFTLGQQGSRQTNMQIKLISEAYYYIIFWGMFLEIESHYYKIYLRLNYHIEQNDSDKGNAKG